ncbi:MAG: RAMP superfamily CRISPR-associated protein [Ruminococcus sp.]|nr:RAMP superfamily CRISPR-associated protein [Ruminococcus sp.]
MNNFNQNSASKNYEFVKFPDKPNCNYVKGSENKNGKHSGSIELKITAVDNLYLGSGFVDFSENSLYAETLVEDEKAIIPESSIKGALRQVCRAISDGCIPNEKNLKLKNEQKIKCKPGVSTCIICDMFGSMGVASKLIFSDFAAEKFALVSCSVGKQFSPHINSEKYMEKGYNYGYKFYFTNCDPVSDESQRIKAVKKGAVFKGKITFKNLDNKELSLLLFGLGIASKSDDLKDYEKFSHKLGGCKAQGFGTVNFKCTGFTLDSEKLTEEAAIEWAKKYIIGNDESCLCSNDCYDSIVEELTYIMKYKE